MDGMTPEIVITGETALTEIQNARQSQKNNYTLVQGKNDEVFSFVNGKDQFLIIPRNMALNSNKIDNHLIISEGLILNNENQMSLISRSVNSTIDVYPAIEKKPNVSFASLTKIKPRFKGVSSYQLKFKEKDPPVAVTKVTDRKYTVVTKGGLMG